MMNVGGGETACPADYDGAILLIPLEHGAWPDAELFANLGRDRDLALRRDF